MRIGGRRPSAAQYSEMYEVLYLAPLAWYYANRSPAVTRPVGQATLFITSFHDHVFQGINFQVALSNYLIIFIMGLYDRGIRLGNIENGCAIIGGCFACHH